jgi:hypothetical protein
MGKYQRGFLNTLDQICHGKGLAGAGYPKQNLMAFSVLDTSDELFDRGSLIAAWREWGYQFKFGHGRHLTKSLNMVQMR